MGRLSIWLCGRVRVEVQGVRVEDRMTRRKSRELLAFLVDGRRTVARPDLIELLWPGEPPGSRDGTFRQLLTEIRHCLGAEAVEGRSQLRLAMPADAWVDTDDAEKTLAKCRVALEARHWGEARELAQAGLDLLSAEFLAGEDADWIQTRRAELEDLALGALESLAAASLADPGHEQTAAHVSRQLISRAPFRESAYSLLMRAQVAQGNPSEALLVFEQLRVLLRDELGTVPSVAMSALHLWVLRQADPDLETITAEAGNEQGAASENQIVDPVPETLYVRKPDGINIAYQTVGDGPTDLVIVPGFMSHLDAQWTDPDYRAWLRQLAKSFRVISLDKAGSGASDPLPRPPSLAEWADDVRAVLDAVGSSKAILLGASEAGPVSIHFALSEPERVAGLILYGSFARVLPDPDYLWKHRGEIAEAVGRFTELGRSWGVGGSADIWAPGVATSDEERYAWAVFERASASPGSASYRSEAVGEIDVRDRLASLQVPTLVLHRRGDQLVLIHYGRYLGKAIPDARYVELPGSCHVPYLGEGDEVEIMLQTIEDFARDSATWNKAGMSPG